MDLSLRKASNQAKPSFTYLQYLIVMPDNPRRLKKPKRRVAQYCKLKIPSAATGDTSLGTNTTWYSTIQSAIRHVSVVRQKYTQVSP